MGVEDREWWKEAQQARDGAGAPPRGRFGKVVGQATQPSDGLTRGLKWGPLGIVVFWLVIMGAVYAGIQHTMKPRQVTISMAGEMTIPRARDGHFYVAGTVAGQPVTFLVDTGASHVTVSQAFARAAGLGQGAPIKFYTANGVIDGRIVADVPVSVGPATISGVKVAVGLLGVGSDKALLGQSFLSKFRITLAKDEMTLRPAS
jgi:aspartyl protease family protein